MICKLCLLGCDRCNCDLRSCYLYCERYCLECFNIEIDDVECHCFAQCRSIEALNDYTLITERNILYLSVIECNFQEALCLVKISVQLIFGNGERSYDRLCFIIEVIKCGHYFGRLDLLRFNSDSDLSLEVAVSNCYRLFTRLCEVNGGDNKSGLDLAVLVKERVGNDCSLFIVRYERYGRILKSSFNIFLRICGVPACLLDRLDSCSVECHINEFKSVDNNIDCSCNRLGICCFLVSYCERLSCSSLRGVEAINMELTVILDISNIALCLYRASADECDIMTLGIFRVACELNVDSAACGIECITDSIRALCGCVCDRDTGNGVFKNVDLGCCCLFNAALCVCEGYLVLAGNNRGRCACCTFCILNTTEGAIRSDKCHKLFESDSACRAVLICHCDITGLGIECICCNAKS